MAVVETYVSHHVIIIIIIIIWGSFRLRQVLMSTQNTGRFWPSVYRWIVSGSIIIIFIIIIIIIIIIWGSLRLR